MRKKKVRGWKRRVKAIDKWVAEYSELNTDYLHKSRRHHVRFYVSPWYDLEKRIPPLWYYRLILKGFLRMHTAWKAQLDLMDIPYKLQLWIFEPRRYWTDLSTCLADSDGEFPVVPFNSNLAGTPFPIDLYRNEGLNAFLWTPYLDEDYLESDDLDLFGTEWAEKEGWNRIPESDYWLKAQGCVWVGELRA